MFVCICHPTTHPDTQLLYEVISILDRAVMPLKLGQGGREDKIGNGEIYQHILSAMMDRLLSSVAHTHACASHKNVVLLCTNLSLPLYAQHVSNTKKTVGLRVPVRIYIKHPNNRSRQVCGKNRGLVNVYVC